MQADATFHGATENEARSVGWESAYGGLPDGERMGERYFIRGVRKAGDGAAWVFEEIDLLRGEVVAELEELFLTPEMVEIEAKFNG